MAITNTPEAEGAQALFCYIADVLGAKKTIQEYKPYLGKVKGASEFFDKHKLIIDKAYSSGAVKTEKSKDVIIKFIEKNNDWFISSLRISQYIIEEVNNISSKFQKIKKPSWDNLFYRHGDDEVMGGMSKLFKSANEEFKKSSGSLFFGNINKWSPADIYFASDIARNVLKKLNDEPETKKSNLKFAKLNQTIGDLIEKAELLPLSLKQVKKDVVIKKVNFNRSDEEKLLAETFGSGVLPYKIMTGDYEAKNQSFAFTKPYIGGRDIYVKLKSGKFDGTLQFRHTPASGGKPSKGFKVVLKYKGSSALGGQVTSFDILVEQIKINDPMFAKQMADVFKKGYSQFEKDMKIYNQYGGGKMRYDSGDKEMKDKFNGDVGAISALTLMNPLRKVIENYFKTPNEKIHNVIRSIFAYVASRTVNSSPFVIAKD
tara:strand:- start:64 stop:1350 length:1287 start_codon:yes stop_codon:yes gene_type:complete